MGDGGTSGQGDRSRFVNDSIGWERGVWEDMYKLDSLASRGRLTCSPPPLLSILIPAMLSMGGTEFIVVPDGSHWRGEGASREGGREGGGTGGDRGTEGKTRKQQRTT